ncbi:LAME_0D01860g1_1 [Lachancea meyersii CBS 8951]|uniref:Sphingoid long-chain base transporter RSB1 n=1 Tax=Lachancea meyersii CBS 8951 TaxID=1266667 RepID=A0A1G4J706_9SACH|nr:LAME_0D01860g1_1 [Lachancea meyersii CBS 8951]
MSLVATVTSAAATAVSAASAASASVNPSDAPLYGPMTPSLPFNTAMAAIFGVLFIAQAIIGVWTRQWWFLVSFLIACGLEVAGYVGRALGHNDTTNIDDYLLQFICLTIAPVFTMAGIYYQLGKLIEIYGHNFALFKNPMLYSYIFIAFDVISLIIQALGGGMAGSAAANYENSDTGDHVFVGGLAFQVASMTAFLYLWFHLVYQIFVATRMEHAGVTRPNWSLKSISQLDLDHKYRPKFEFLRIHPQRWIFVYFPWALTFSVIFVYIRCIYRVAELAEGWSGNLITHEVYFIILDALMISLATTILTVFHPGIAFKGHSVKIPIEKASKSQGSDFNAHTISDSSSEAFGYNDKETEPRQPLPRPLSAVPLEAHSLQEIRKSTDRAHLA